MNTQFTQLLITVVLILLSGTLWYLYAFRQFQLQQESEFAEIYIDVVRNKNSIRVENVPPHVYFRVDGDFMQEGELELK